MTWEKFEDFWQLLWKYIYLFFKHFGYDTPLPDDESIPCDDDK